MVVSRKFVSQGIPVLLIKLFIKNIANIFKTLSEWIIEFVPWCPYFFVTFVQATALYEIFGFAINLSLFSQCSLDLHPVGTSLLLLGKRFYYFRSVLRISILLECNFFFWVTVFIHKIGQVCIKNMKILLFFRNTIYSQQGTNILPGEAPPHHQIHGLSWCFHNFSCDRCQ